MLSTRAPEPLSAAAAFKNSGFTGRLKQAPCVLSISYISGDYDYLLQVVPADMEQYQSFAEIYLVEENNVKKYLNLFEMKSIKASTVLPLPSV